MSSSAEHRTRSHRQSGAPSVAGDGADHGHAHPNAGQTTSLAIPTAAGALYPSLGLMLRPVFGALATSAACTTVVSNALLLRREVPPPA